MGATGLSGGVEEAADATDEVVKRRPVFIDAAPRAPQEALMEEIGGEGLLDEQHHRHLHKNGRFRKPFQDV